MPHKPGPPGHCSPEAGWSSLSSASTEGQIAATKLQQAISPWSPYLRPVKR
jgi:hypothetical protein